MDELDRAQAAIETIESAGVSMAREAAQNIPAGNPGECDYCGEFSGRLVNGACAPCRDKRGLK